jgi:hypothetical protein
LPARRFIIGEQRIAAGFVHFDGVKHRRLGRAGHEYLVGMPVIAEIALVALELDDLENLRMAFHRLHEGMGVNGAEALGETHLGVRAQILVAEEDDLMVEPGLFDFGEDRLRQRLGQIGAGDHRAEGTGDRGDVDMAIGHGGSPVRPASNAACRP